MRLPIIHTLASAVAAALLFAVQPWAAKVLLPAFGGSTSVWLTSLLFFQVAVVLGYLHAHMMSRGPAFIHVIWCATAAFFIPIGVSPQGLGLPAVAEVLLALAAGLGIVIVLVSATTPLLHTWLARDAEDDEPYALYAASNAGSLVGLVAYPLMIEPFVGLADQAVLWRVMFGFVAFAVGLSAFLSRKREAVTVVDVPLNERSPRGPWFIRSFIPASLLYGFTAFVTRDIAAVPLIWVVPLAVYLVTFILAFKPKPVRMPAAFHWAGPLILSVTAIVSVVWPAGPLALGCHLVAFATFAMYFHGELSEARPGSSEATAFYLWVSFGGVAAGVANTVLGPMWFDAPLEYPLTYGIALVLIPASYVTKLGSQARLALYATMLVALGVVFAQAPGAWGPKLGAAAVMLFAFAVAIGMPALSHVMLAVSLAAAVTYPGDATVVHRERSFYGAHAVQQRTIDDIAYLQLADGVIMHGQERVEGALEPLGYYHSAGPCGDVMKDVAGAKPTLHVALVGLGMGSMALYSRPGDVFQFFELDPAVADLAGSHFRSLPGAQGEVRIDVTDGRLGLQGSADRYDLIVVDAFSSDSVPTHLLTREAFELYGARLADGGRLLLHTSNRYLDLGRVAIGALESLGWNHRHKRWDLRDEMPPGAWPTSWIVAAPARGDIGGQSTDPTWQVLRSEVLWTDSYSSLLRAIR